MMAAEMPVCTGFVNSLPDHRVQLASLLALYSVALFVESPVIDLLATSTTLASSKASFAAIRRFSLWLMGWCGLLHLLIAVTPLFDVVFLKVLALPPEVAEAVRLPLLILVPWSPAIGWRRHVQGLLIRKGVTGAIGLGTLLRICTIAIVGTIAFLSHAFPGAVVAAISLTCSVIAEAIFIHLVGRRALREKEFHDDDAELRVKDLSAFHFPLTVSTIVSLSSLLMVSRSLASVPDAILAMNAWQVATTLVFMLRTMTFALPEVVIANWRPGQSSRLLGQFCLGTGAGLSALMLVLAVTRLDVFFFTKLTHADSLVAENAHVAVLWCCLLPLFSAATSYVKGILTRLKVTMARMAATLASVVVLALVLFLGIKSQSQGVIVAAAAMTLSQLTEFLVLTLILWLSSSRSGAQATKNSA